MKPHWQGFPCIDVSHMIYQRLSGIFLPPDIFLEEAVDKLDLEGPKWLNLLVMDSMNKTEISQWRANLGSELAKPYERYWAGTSEKIRWSCVGK